MRKNLILILCMVTLVFFAFGYPCSAAGDSSWNGDWTTGVWGTLTLVQSSPGSDVTGTYLLKNEYTTASGRISGTVSGNVMTGTWSQAPRYIPKDFELTMSGDGSRFQGVYYEGPKEGNPPYRVTGTRVSGAAPIPRTTTQDPDDSGCRFAGMTGQVEVLLPGAGPDDWKLAKMDMVLPAGTHIRTQEDSSAILHFYDMSTFVLKQDSEVVTDSKAGPESKLKLVAGNIWANLKKIAENRAGSMEIEMNQAVCGIKGTTFVAEVAKDGTSTLKVIEGSVEFTAKADGKKVMVGGGTMVSADQKGLGTPVKFDVAAETASWDAVKARVSSGSPAGSPAGSPVQTQKSPSSLFVVIGTVAIIFGLDWKNRQ